MPLGRDRLAARLLDNDLGLALADLGVERHGHGFRHDQPLRDLEIVAHALGVDVETFGEIGDGGDGA